MKTRNLILSLVTLLASGFFTHTSSFAAGGNDGSGGAGVFKDGKYQTFYSAGIYVEPIYLTEHDLPEMVQLRNEILAMDLNPVLQGRIVEILVPSFNRKFLKVDAIKFSRAVYENIKEEYRKIFRDERLNIAIYAVTQPENKTTFILPEFERLNYIEKMVMMFHETMWVLYPKASYYDIARMDVYLQNYLEKKDAQSRFQFIDAFDGFLEAMRNLRVGYSERPYISQVYQYSLLGSTLRYDLRHGSLSGLVDNRGQVSIENFFGTDFLSCVSNVNPNYYEFSKSITEKCSPLFRNHVLALQQKYPNSYFLKAVIRAATYVALGSKRDEANSAGDKCTRLSKLQYAGTMTLSPSHLDRSVYLKATVSCAPKQKKCVPEEVEIVSLAFDESEN